MNRQLTTIFALLVLVGLAACENEPDVTNNYTIVVEDDDPTGSNGGYDDSTDGPTYGDPVGGDDYEPSPYPDPQPDPPSRPQPWDCPEVEIVFEAYSGEAYVAIDSSIGIEDDFVHYTAGDRAVVSNDDCLDSEWYAFTIDNPSNDHARFAIFPKRASSRRIAISQPWAMCVEPHGYLGYLVTVPPQTWSYTFYVFPQEEDHLYNDSWSTLFWYPSDRMYYNNTPNDTRPGACDDID